MMTNLRRGSWIDAFSDVATPGGVGSRGTMAMALGPAIVGEGTAGNAHPKAPYFVDSKSITAWQPPHEHDPLSDHDKEVVLRAPQHFASHSPCASRCTRSRSMRRPLEGQVRFERPMLRAGVWGRCTYQERGPAMPPGVTGSSVTREQGKCARRSRTS